MPKTKIVFTAEDRDLLQSYKRQAEAQLKTIENLQKEIKTIRENAKEYKKAAAEKAKQDAERRKAIREMRQLEAAAWRELRKEQRDALREQQKAERERVRLARITAREMARAAKEAAKEQKRADEETAKRQQENSKATERIVTGVAGVAAGWFGVTSLIGAAGTALQDHENKLKDLADQARNAQASMIDALFASGNLSGGPELVGKIRQATPGLEDDQRARLFQSISGSMSDKTLDEKLGVLSNVAPLVVGGVSTQMAAQVGSLAGEFAGGGRKADDAVDLAVAMRDIVGEDDFMALKQAGFLRTTAMLQEQGMSLEQGLGFGASALLADVDPRAIEKAVASINDTTLEKRSGGRLSTADRAYNRFVAADANGRRDMLFNDPEVRMEMLGGVGAGKFGMISPESIGGIAQKLKDAQTNNVAAAAGGHAASIGSGVVAQQAAASQLESAGREKAIFQQMREDTDAFLTEMETKKDIPFLTSMVGRTPLRTIRTAVDLFGRIDERSEDRAVRATYGDKVADRLRDRQEKFMQALMNERRNSRPSVVENPERGR